MSGQKHDILVIFRSSDGGCSILPIASPNETTESLRMAAAVQKRHTIYHHSCIPSTPYQDSVDTKVVSPCFSALSVDYPIVHKPAKVTITHLTWATQCWPVHGSRWTGQSGKLFWFQLDGWQFWKG